MQTDLPKLSEHHAGPTTIDRISWKPAAGEPGQSSDLTMQRRLTVVKRKAVVKTEATPKDARLVIPKPEPGGFDLNRFKSKRDAAAANIETLPSALPVHNAAAAKDFIRLHPNEETHWSVELCFVNVPIKGQKHDTLHLITEDLATQFLEGGEILRFRVALATKPGDSFFLCTIPTQNLDNLWNTTNLDGCEKAKTYWTKFTSRKGEGAEGYKISFARDLDSFGEPNWPTQPLDELIAKTFAGRMIEAEDHPALLRKVGAKQSLS